MPPAHTLSGAQLQFSQDQATKQLVFPENLWLKTVCWTLLPIAQALSLPSRLQSCSVWGKPLLSLLKTQDDAVTNVTTTIYYFSYSEKRDSPFQPAEIW